MYICYTDTYVYSLYERSFFDVQHWHWGPRQKICIIIIYNMCVSHCNANYICTWRSTSHMSTYTYIYVYVFDLHGPRHIQKTRPKLIAIEPKLIANPLKMSRYFFWNNCMKLYEKIRVWAQLLMFEAFDHLVCLIHVVCWPDPQLDGKHSEFPSGNSIKRKPTITPINKDFDKALRLWWWVFV